MSSAYKKALVTGITGQDGSYLAALLLDKGYEVHGLRQCLAFDDGANIRDIESKLTLHPGDMTDGGSLTRIVAQIRPDEIYNLAAQSYVADSFAAPEMTADVNGLGTLRLLDAVRAAGLEKTSRIYQASSSELFGNAPSPQNEQTPMRPCNPYGAAKLYAFSIIGTYRQAYGMFACNGILFNHESPRRGEHFVTRKIVLAAAAIEAGRQEKLVLGNLSAERDWGHARDYVAGMWQMLQQAEPDDYVLATGEAHTVREFAEQAFSIAGMHIEWRGEGLHEKGYDRATGRVLVEVSEAFYRPSELHHLCGDPRKARARLGWVPETGFTQLVREMVESERRALGFGVAPLLRQVS